MKKRILILLFSAACVLTCVFGLTACDSGPGFDHEHNFVITVVDPTCTENGYRETKCTVCGYAYSGTIEALGHDEVVDKGYPATCTEDGLTDGKHCFDCGEITVEQVVIPKGHKEVVDEAVEPTCTNDGLTEGSHCSGCDEIFVEQVAIPATGHTEVADEAVANTCTEDGLTQGSHCSKCGETLVEQIITPAKGHTLDVYNYCSVCDKDIATEGLIYTLNDDSQSYSVVGVGTATDKIIYIAHTYNGKPVTRIGEDAFSNRYGVEIVYIPASVTSIEDGAFRGCYSLTDITIPPSVTSMGKAAFGYCYNLARVTIFSSKIHMGRSVFGYCSSLEYNTYDSAKYLGNSVNPYVMLVEVTDKDITSITLPDTTNIIAPDAFGYCTLLKTISMPDSINCIGTDAFDFCSSLEYNTYDNAKYLGNSENPYVVLIKAVSVGITSCKINDKTKVIYREAFMNSNITSITIPALVTSIEPLSFCRCAKLSSVTVESGNKVYHSEGNCIIETASKTLVLGCHNSVIPSDGSVTFIGSGAFDGREKLTGIVIPSTIIGIGGGAFEACYYLTDIEIPSSVVSIGLGAFQYCRSLTSITIPSSVMRIESDAFASCEKLTDITIGSSVEYIGVRVVAKCGSLTSITVDSKNKVYHSAGNSIIETESGTLVVGCRSSVIPNDGSVTSIGEYAFSNCAGLTDIEIPDTVTSICEVAFWCCYGLKSVKIPDSVVNLAYGAFAYCSSLESITLSNSIKRLETYVFTHCSSLSVINFEGTVAEWEAIHKSNYWDSETGDYTVKCSNGELSKAESVR